ncbi:MAG: hypothetical protein WBN85_00575, partial [Candidatus Macondimonas sp.]
FVRGQAIQELIRRWPSRQPVRPGEHQAVLRHLVSAEQFSTQRRLVGGGSPRPGAAAKAGFHAPQKSGELAIGIQVGRPLEETGASPMPTSMELPSKRRLDAVQLAPFQPINPFLTVVQSPEPGCIEENRNGFIRMKPGP